MTRLIRRRHLPSSCFTWSRALRAALLTPFLGGALAGCARTDLAEHDALSDQHSKGAHIISAIETSEPPGQRSFLPVQWEPMWARGGRNEEQLLAVVSALLPHEHGLVVVDQGTLELHSLEATDGRTQWRIGRKGGGPGEFQDIGDITMDRDGNTVALDRLLGRISAISAAGTLLPYRASQSLQFAHAICALDDGSIAAVMLRPEAWLAVVRDSVRERAYSFPASIPSGAPEFVTSAYFARGESASTCPLFTLFGYGIGSIRSATDSLRLRPYVQSLTPPEFEVVRERSGTSTATTVTLKRGATAASRGSVWRDTVMLNFAGGDGADRYTMDLYNTAGRYLGSWRYPAQEIDFAVYANGVLYTLSNTTVAPQITAWRRTTSSSNSP